MSKFNHYAVSLDKAVKKYREKYHAAEKAMQKAKADFEKAEEASKHHDFRETPLEKLRRESEVTKYKTRYEEAKIMLNAAWEDRFSLMAQAEKLRNQLADDVTAAYCADPKAIDPATMTLLDSGILTAQEYQRLFNDAVEAGNHTMQRIIKGYAENLRRENEKHYGQNYPDNSILNAVAHSTTMNDGRAILADFDTLKTCVRYIVGNPEIQRDGNAAMLDRWDELIGQAVEEF